MFTANNLLNKRARNKSVGHAGRIRNHRYRLQETIESTRNATRGKRKKKVYENLYYYLYYHTMDLLCEHVSCQPVRIGKSPIISKYILMVLNFFNFTIVSNIETVQKTRESKIKIPVKN